jgi:oligopeptide transport system substrate-binding protein
VVAGDFLFSIRRMADPSVSAPYFSYVEKRILGLAEFATANSAKLKAGKPVDLDAPVAGLEADPDPHTFHFVLNEPFPQLKYIMALRCCTPQAREAWERYGKEIRRHPVGTGPFVLSEYLSKQRIVLTPNPNRIESLYPSKGDPGDAQAGLLDDAGKPLPRSDGITYTIIRESISSWNRFLQGYEDTWGVNQTNYQSVMANPAKLTAEMERRGVQLQHAAIPNILGFVFNMDDPTFGGYTPRKRKLRQAISLAIDRQEIIDLFTQGTASPAEFLVPPTLGGYDPRYRNPYSGSDVAKAKRLLSEAGYPNGIDPKSGERLVMYFDNAATDALGRQYVGLMRRQIGRIGINVVNRSWRPVVMSDRMEKGQWQFAEYAWFADYPDPEMFLLMLYSPNKRPGMDASNYRNPEVDRLFEQIRIMDDSPERERLIHRIRDIVVEDCPWVYVRHNQSLLLSQSWLKNRKMPQVDDDAAKYWTVDTAERARKIEEWNRPVVWPAVAGMGAIFAGSIPAVLLVRCRSRRSLRDRGRRG